MEALSHNLQSSMPPVKSQQRKTRNRAVRSPSHRDETPAEEEEKATLILGDDGTIEHISEEARRLLDLGSRPLAGGSFFTRISPQDSFRVKQVLIEMSTEDKSPVTGLIQLKTGLGPWQWFKVEVTTRLQYDEEPGVVLRLYERGNSNRRR